MSKTTFDVRTDENFEVDKIVFANHLDKTESWEIAEYLDKVEDGLVAINGNGDAIFIQDKHHALNLIKALEKAIELKWLV
jgi:hypothetical protein